MTKIGLASPPVLQLKKGMQSHPANRNVKLMFSGSKTDPAAKADDTSSVTSATPSPQESAPNNQSEAKKGFAEQIIEQITQFFQELKEKFMEQVLPKIRETFSKWADDLTERFKGESSQSPMNEVPLARTMSEPIFKSESMANTEKV